MPALRLDLRLDLVGLGLIAAVREDDIHTVLRQVLADTAAQAARAAGNERDLNHNYKNTIVAVRFVVKKKYANKLINTVHKFKIISLRKVARFVYYLF